MRARQLWGSDVYTEDSDLVAVLMHCGYWYHTRERSRAGRARANEEERGGRAAASRRGVCGGWPAGMYAWQLGSTAPGSSSRRRVVFSAAAGLEEDSREGEQRREVQGGAAAHRGPDHCPLSHPSPGAPSAVSQAPPQVAEVRAVLRPQPPRALFPSTARNSIRSRAWAAPIQGCSYSVEKCWVVTRSGTTVDLQPNLDGVPAAAPTFTPSHMERMVTRSVGTGGRQRQLQEVTVLFNLVNEPWPKYNMTAVADKGLRPHEWTSARLHAQCLYLESHRWAGWAAGWWLDGWLRGWAGGCGGAQRWDGPWWTARAVASAGADACCLAPPGALVPLELCPS